MDEEGRGSSCFVLGFMVFPSFLRFFWPEYRWEINKLTLILNTKLLIVWTLKDLFVSAYLVRLMTYLKKKKITPKTKFILKNKLENSACFRLF